MQRGSQANHGGTASTPHITRRMGSSILPSSCRPSRPRPFYRARIITFAFISARSQSRRVAGCGAYMRGWLNADEPLTCGAPVSQKPIVAFACCLSVA